MTNQNCVRITFILSITCPIDIHLSRSRAHVTVTFSRPRQKQVISNNEKVSSNGFGKFYVVIKRGRYDLLRMNSLKKQNYIRFE